MQRQSPPPEGGLLESLDQQLIELEHLYRTAPVGLCLVDREMRFVRINERLAEINGKPVSEHIGRTLREVIPDVASKVEPLYRRVLGSGEAIRNLEVCGRTHADPEREICCLVSYYPIQALDGTVRGVSTVVQDITERKQMERTLRESEEKYRLVAETAMDSIITIDRESRIIYANPATEKIFGYPVPELLGRLLTDLMPEALRSRHAASIRKFIGSGRRNMAWGGVELAGLHRSGREIPIEISFGVMEKADGTHLFTGIVRDITERKRADQALREGEARYRTLVENSPDAICVLDSETGRFVDFNQNALDLFRLKREELLSVGPVEVSPPFQPDGRPSAEVVKEKLARAVQGGQLAFEWTHRDSEGREIPCEVRLVRFPAKDRILLGGSITDITERKRARRALDERLRFEALISEISGKFIHLPSSEVGREIDHGLRLLGRFLGVDRSYLGEFSENREQLRPTHWWIADGIESEPLGDIVANVEFPWLTGRILEGKVFALPRVTDLPDSASEERRYARRTGIQSALFVPLVVGGKILGALGFDSIREEKDWPHELVQRLRIVGEIFANALTRRGAEQERRKSEERLRVLLETTNAVPWEASASTWEFTYVGPQAVQLLGYPVEEWYEEGFWESRIHPEDRERAVDFCRESTRRRKDFEFEYRVIASDGRILWLHDLVSVESSGGVPATLRGFLIDITERKRAELLQAGQKRVLELLARGEPLVEVLCELVRTIDNLETGMRCSVLLLDDEGKRLRHLAAPNLPEEYNRAIDGMEIGPKEGSCGSAAFRGKRVVVTDILGDPLWVKFRELAKRFHLRACWSQPILSQSGRVLGTFAMYYDRPYHPTEVEIGLMEQAAYLAGVAIERTRSNEALREREAALRKSHKALQDLAGRLLSAQEEERRRLARELHDDLTQRLAALAIEAGNLEKEGSRLPARISGRFREMKEQIVKLSEDIHGISRQLHPTIIDDLGLLEAVSSECSRFAEREGISVRFTPENVPDPLPRGLSLCVYRVVQESLRNIAKHSRAKEAQVSLRGVDGGIHLTIRDSGIGFDPVRVRGRGGLGLAGMEERVRLLHGELSVHSRPGGGTVIEVRTPLVGGDG